MTTTSRPLLDADYAAIEARIVNWLAGQEDALDRFRAYDAAASKREKEEKDVYRLQAAEIFQIPLSQVEKFPHRFMGKEAILGGGFGMGPPKLRVQCKKKGYDLPEGLEFKVIKVWRNTHKKVVRFWGDLEQAAMNAVSHKGTMFKVGPHLAFKCFDTAGMPFLFMRLPSGRKLAYPRPKIVPGKFEGTQVVAFYTNLKGVLWGWKSVWGGVWAENCLSGDTQVLSHKLGWIELRSVTKQDGIWDGVDFVRHQGLLLKGKHEVMDFYGMKVTPDHQFLAGSKWVSAKDACTFPPYKLSSLHESSLPLSSQHSVESHRKSIWESVCYSIDPTGRTTPKISLALLVQLWKAVCEDRGRTSQKAGCCGGLWAPVRSGSESSRRQECNSQDEPAPGFCCMEQHESPLQQPPASSMEELRGPRDQRVRSLAGIVRELLGRYGAELRERLGHQSKGQQRQLHQEELQLGDPSGELPEQAQHSSAQGSTSGLLGCSSGKRGQEEHPLLSSECWPDLAANTEHSSNSRELVYDILNCGPRQRFAVRGRTGPILIAHNCTQAVAADVMANGAHNCEHAGYQIATLIHDQALAYHQEGQTPEEFVRLLTDLPSWADGLPIAAEGALVPFYKKD